MATIQTATGPIDSDELGFTLTHEHVVVGSPPIRQQFPDLHDRDAILDVAVPNLIAAREAGVRSMVDLTPITLGRDAALIREASERSGVQIIVATGLVLVPRPAHDVRAGGAARGAVRARHRAPGSAAPVCMRA